MQTTTVKSKRAAPRPAARPLVDLLADLVDAHEELLRASAAQREAILRADPGAMGAAQSRLASACARISSLDQERAGMVAALAPGGPGATLSCLAAGLAEPERGRAVELAATLRELIERARTDQRRLRAATDSMLRHVRGVMQHVQRGLNHAGVYGRAGRVEPGAAVTSGIDLTR